MIRLTSVLLLALAALPLMATEPDSSTDLLEELRVGHWVEVRGSLRGDRFLAERIELRPARSAARLWGVASPGTRPGHLEVLGRQVATRADTRWRGGRRDDVLGHRVSVIGQRGAGGRLVAQSVQLREPGVERVEGRIDRIEVSLSGEKRLRILGFLVVVPEHVKQRQRAATADIDRVPPAPIVSASLRVNDLDDLIGDGFQLGTGSHIGLLQDVTFNARRNFELDQRDDVDVDDRDDRDDTSHNLRARWSWTPGPKVTTVVDARHRIRRRDIRGEDTSTSTRTRLGEAFVLARDIGFGLDLQVGRQDFDDPREWLYDQNLDGVRLYREAGHWLWEASISTSLSDASNRDQDATNTIFYVSRALGRRHLAGYVVHRDFGSARAERQTHVGVRVLGPWTARIEGWADLAVLSGQRDQREVLAWGGDVGARWVSDSPMRWTLTGGLAWGSGDDGSERDRGFRQTGLQDNNGRVGGVTAVRYYGELIDPELANLRIATLGLGLRFWRRSSVELIAHHYRQDSPSERLLNTNLDRRPNGVDLDLGWELDLVVGVRRFRHWDVELVGAYFDQGRALGDGDDATLGALQIRYRY